MRHDSDRTGETQQDQFKPPRLEEIIPVVWGARKGIVLFTIVITVATLLLNYFVLPPRYTALATLLPETEGSKVSTLGQVADIAQLAGVNIPGSEIARLYPAIVESEVLLREVIERDYEISGFDQPVNLMQYFDLEDEPAPLAFDLALRKLRAAVDAAYDSRTNIVTVSAELEDPRLAADVLNGIIDGLDRFMREKKTTNATEQREWVEIRLEEVEQEMKKSEEMLTRFRERNRRVSDSPELLQEQDRMLRELQINSTLFIELKKQYELAKIEEIKNVTIVNVLDRARTPVRKSAPQRAVNTLIMFVLSATGATIYHIVKSRYAVKIRSLLLLFGKGGIDGTEAGAVDHSKEG